MSVFDLYGAKRIAIALQVLKRLGQTTPSVFSVETGDKLKQSVKQKYVAHRVNLGCYTESFSLIIVDGFISRRKQLGKLTAETKIQTESNSKEDRKQRTLSLVI